MSEPNMAAGGERKVGIGLFLGILFLPFIFAWVTLQKGFSLAVRAVAFSWFVVVLIAVTMNGNKPPSNDVAAPSTPATAGPVQPAPAPVKAYSEAERKRILAKMSISRDKVEDKIWYRDRTTSEALDTNGLYLYLGQVGDGLPYIRMVIRYSGHDWIFYNRVVIKADEQTFEYLPDRPEHHVGYGYVSEWVDVNVIPENMTMMKTVAHAKDVTIRVVGDQFRYDRTVKPKERQAILNVIDAYHVLGGTEY